MVVVVVVVPYLKAVKLYFPLAPKLYIIKSKLFYLYSFH